MSIDLEAAKTRRVERFIHGSTRVDPEGKTRVTLSLIDRFERIGDELIQLDEMARVLATMMAGLTYEAVVERLVFSARRGFFGFHEPGRARHAVRDLLDLNNFPLFQPTQYPLRPSVLTVTMAPQLMWARRSVWVRWIRAQEWPVPPDLMIPAAIVPEAEPAQLSDEQEPVATGTEETETPQNAKPEPIPATKARRRGPQAAHKLDRVRKKIVELGSAYPGTKRRKEWATEFGVSLATLDRASSEFRLKSSEFQD